MALNFPSSPVLDQTYTNGTRTWKWDGVSWNSITSADNPVLTGKTISVDDNTISGIAESSFVISDSSGNIDGTTLKAIPTGEVVGTTDAQVVNSKTLGTGTLFGALVNGQDNNLTRVELQDYGYAFYDSNSSSTINFTNGSVQRWTPTASSNPTLTISDWPPTGNLGELLIEAVNLGAAGTTIYPTANWIKSDGSFAVSPSAAGITFKTAGIDFILFWTRDAGATLYAKVVR